jgi:hypothetical protein
MPNDSSDANMSMFKDMAKKIITHVSSKKTRPRRSKSRGSTLIKKEEEDMLKEDGDEMKSMLEDMVKNVITNMANGNESDLNNDTISSEKEFKSIKAEGRRVSRSPKRRSSSRSSVSSRRSEFSKKDFSKMDLVGEGEEDLSTADNDSASLLEEEEEEDKLIAGNDDSSSTVKKDRRSKPEGKKKKKIMSEGKKGSKLKSSRNTDKSKSVSNIPTCVKQQRQTRVSDLSFFDQKEIMDDSDESDNYSVSSNFSKPGTSEFNQEMALKLRPHRKMFCIQDASNDADTSG